MASTYIALPLENGGGGGAVSSFNGRTGAVVPLTGDYNASQITFTPAGNISATNVQLAIEELDTEKQATITGGASSIVTLNLTIDRALISDGAGKVAVSPTTAAELAFVNGVTSNLQTQINGKEATIVVLPIAKGGTNSGLALTGNKAIVSNGTAIVESATTAAEIGFVAGATSNLQLQIDGKQPLDATLTALAAYNTNGILTQTAADTFVGRTITGTASQITVVDGDGVAGNPTLSLTNTGTSTGSFTNASVTIDAQGRITAASSGSATELDNNTDSIIYEEFNGNSNVWNMALTGTSSGTGASDQAVTTGIGATEKAIGVHSIDTGTTTNGRTTIHTNINSTEAGFATLTFEARAAITSLGGATNIFHLTLGYIDNTGTGTGHVDGAYFEFIGDTTQTAWRCVTSAASTRTTTVTTSTGLVNVFQRFKIIINEAGTSVQFLIDNTVVATHTTNIPGAGQFFGKGAKIINSAGTTSYDALLDYFKFKANWSAGR